MMTFDINTALDAMHFIETGRLTPATQARINADVRSIGRMSKATSIEVQTVGRAVKAATTR